jgi:hypothetical protein
VVVAREEEVVAELVRAELAQGPARLDRALGEPGRTRQQVGPIKVAALVKVVETHHLTQASSDLVQHRKTVAQPAQEAFVNTAPSMFGRSE